MIELFDCALLTHAGLKYRMAESKLSKRQVSLNKEMQECLNSLYVAHSSPNINSSYLGKS